MPLTAFNSLANCSIALWTAGACSCRFSITAFSHSILLSFVSNGKLLDSGERVPLEVKAGDRKALGEVKLNVVSDSVTIVMDPNGKSCAEGEVFDLAKGACTVKNP